MVKYTKTRGTMRALTSKIGILWTFNVSSLSNLIVIMPSGTMIVSMSQIPLNVKTINMRAQISLPPSARVYRLQKPFNRMTRRVEDTEWVPRLLVWSCCVVAAE